MHVAQSRRRWFRLIVTLVLVASVKEVAADGWKIQLMGAKNLGSSHAGRSVLADDASAVWFNPASMSLLAGQWQLTAGAPLITYQLDFQDAGSRSVLGMPLTGESNRNGGKVAVVPHVYLAARLGTRWHFGFGFNAPYGLGTSYGDTWVGRYHATETMLTVFNLNPAVAVRLGDRVSVGFGIDVQRSDATLANMIDFGSIGAAGGLPLVPQGQDGSVSFTGGDWAAGFNAGARWQAAPRTAIGAAYRSQVVHTLRGLADFTVPTAAAPLTLGGRLFSDTDAAVELPMPNEVSISASQDLNDDWKLLGDFTWTQWSRFKELRVTFDNPLQPPVQQAANWNDTWRVAAGATRRFDRWLVRTGVAYETTPVPDATRTPRLPEENHLGLSGGASYSSSDRWTFDASFSHFITPDAELDLTDPAAGLVKGQVHWRLNVVAVSLTRRF